MGRKGAAGILVTHQCGVYGMRTVVLLARKCLAGTLWLATGTHCGGGGGMHVSLPLARWTHI